VKIVTSNGHFDRALLPPPRTFFLSEGVEPKTRPNSRGYVSACCPLHDSKSGRSFTFNVDTGAWICWAGCGRGDMIGFTMQRYGMDFKAACQRIGCWTEQGKRKPVRVKLTRAVPYLVMDFTVDGEQYRAEVRDEPKDDFQRLRRIYAEAKDRLHEIRDGDAERFPGEEETQWKTMANSWELIEEMENR
jgi:hypothetical protein